MIDKLVVIGEARNLLPNFLICLMFQLKQVKYGSVTVIKQLLSLTKVDRHDAIVKHLGQNAR